MQRSLDVNLILVFVNKYKNLIFLFFELRTAFRMRKITYRVIFIYLLVVYFLFYGLYLFMEPTIQKFSAKSYAIEIDFGFVLWSMVYFFSFYFGCKLNLNNVDIDNQLKYRSFSKLLFITLGTLFLVYWTDSEIIQNNYGVLGRGNVQSTGNMAGIVLNIREIVIPALLLTLLTIKKKYSLIINVLIITIIIYFIVGESLYRYTKSGLIIFIVGGAIAYLQNNKMSVKAVVLFLLSLLFYFLFSDLITAMRFINVGDVSLEEINQLERLSFFESLIVKMDRLTGFKDFYYAYKLLGDKSYLPVLTPFFDNPNAFYSYNLLGVDPDSFHSSAVGFFGFFMLSFGLPLGAIVLFGFGSLIKCLFDLIKLVKTPFTYYLIFYSFFFDILGGVLDGNLKYFVFSRTMSLRLVGVVIFIILFNLYIDKKVTINGKHIKNN